MSINSIKLQLQDAGWNIKEEFLENHFKEVTNFHSVVKRLLDTDLKEAGAPSLASDVGKGKSSQFKTPIILQVTNIRNVSAPKANEESATAPRMLRLTLTDGTNYVHGLEINLIKSVSLKTAPGTKIKLHSRIPVVESYLMLSPSNTELVGGVVEELFQKWKLSESVSKYSRSAVLANDGSGPPPWVPFGKKILAEKDGNFKAMGDPSVKKKENDEFEVQRQQVVQELSKEGSQKVFGGGKQMLDSSVQKIINSGGFTIEEAEWALKRNKNDIKKALQDLRRSQNGFEEEDARESYSFEERGRRGGRRGRGRGRGGKDNKGPDGSDDEVPHTVMARPSGPASLLDYLESRIAEKGGAELESPRIREEKQEYRHPPRGRDQRGRRGRGRGRGDYHQTSSSNVYKNEPSLSAESWPTLGEEPRSNSAVAQPTVDRKTNPLSTSSSSTTYSQNNYSHSQSERGNQYSSYKDNQHSYKNYNYKSDNLTNNGGEKSYQHNSYKESNRQLSYRSEPQYLDVSQGGENFGRRAEQPYYKRGMGRDLHKGSNSSIRGQTSNQSYGANPSQHYNQDNDFNRSESANYTSESTAYSGGNAKYLSGGGTNYGGSGGSASYGDTSYSANRGSMNYGGNGGSANYGGRGGNTNYGGANYSGGTKYGISANYSGGGNYGGMGGSANYSGGAGGRGGGNYSGSGGSGNYSGRGGSANYGRGGGTNYRGSGGTPNYDSERSANYGASGGSANYDGSGGSVKVHTAKEKELIAQFEKSMVMAGCYEDSSHNSKNQSYTQGYRQEQQQQHYDNYSQGFSGSFEFHRGGGGGGDGYSRRSRGGRRGRY